MAELDLSQAEADSLISMQKYRADEKQHDFPLPGDRLSVELLSADRHEKFVLDVSRASIKLTKATYQSRARQAVVLVRLDIDGAPHRNPDGQEIPCPHVHVYREGYGDKWAVDALPEGYTSTDDLYGTLLLFMQKNNIVQQPHILKGLFA